MPDTSQTGRPRVGDMRVARRKTMWAVEMWRVCDCPDCIQDGHWMQEATYHTAVDAKRSMDRWTEA